MVIEDRKQAEFYLQHLNYYRLCAYWLPFEANHSTHTFRPGTTFDAVLNLYIFDRQLRLHVLDAIERVEVSVRSNW
ncbi:MAG: Abi family protein [Prosthecochloris sp.]|nr:Abi family protein [Prosthecochloris sp.]